MLTKEQGYKNPPAESSIKDRGPGRRLSVAIFVGVLASAIGLNELVVGSPCCKLRLSPVF